MNTPKEEAEEIIYSVSNYVTDDSLIRPCAADRVINIIEALEHHAWQNRDYIDFYNSVLNEIKDYEHTK